MKTGTSSGADVKISYSQVEAYCEELHYVANEMKTKIEEIKDKINSISAYWESGGASNYIQKSNKLLANFEEAYKEIETSILYMASCAEGYQAIDSKIMGEICANLNIGSPSEYHSNIFPVD